MSPDALDAILALHWLIALVLLLLIGWAVWEFITAPEEEYPGQYGPVELTPEQIERRDQTYAEADAMWGDEAAQVDAEWARIEAVINAEDIAMWEREMGEVA